MAFTVSNDYISGRKQLPTPAGSEVITVNFELALATADLALNSIGQIGALPAGCVPVDARVYGADIDSSTAAAVFQIAVGNRALQNAAGTTSADAANTLISTVAADGGGAWGDTSTAVTTAFDKPLTRLANNMATVTALPTDRSIIMKVTTAPTTAVAGTVGLQLSYRAA